MKVAFIGGGMMAQVGHLPFYRADRRVEVVAIAESRPSLAAALGVRFAVPVVERYEDLLADPSIAAVVISAPRPAVGPLVLTALEAGKHVISEKPMAHTAEQGRRLVEEATRRGLQYHVGFMKRHDGGIRAARSLLKDIRRDGRLGRLLGARFYDYSAEYAVPPPAHTRPGESRVIRFPTWPSAPDWLADALQPAYAWYMNAISHDVNLARFFLGDGLTVTAAHRPTDGALTALLEHDGVAVSIEACRTAAGRWLEGAEFLFEKGRLAVEIPSPMALDEQARTVIEARDHRIEVPLGEPGWCFERQARAFIDALIEGHPSDSTGADCLGDLDLIEDIWRHIGD